MIEREQSAGTDRDKIMLVALLVVSLSTLTDASLQVPKQRQGRLRIA